MTASTPNVSSTADEAFDPFAGPAIIATAPSTEPQREIWTATLLGDDASLAYNESVSLRMLGVLDVDSLASSLTALVERHESLRCTISADGTALCVLAHMAARVLVEDISHLAETDRSNRIDEHLSKIVEETFDLERGPLFRAHLFVLGLNDHLLTFTAHHIVFDGFSTAILIDEWGQLYSALKHRTSLQLPPAEAFSEYARQVRRDSEANLHLPHERYWIEQFRGDIPVLDLPYDRPRPPIKTYTSRRLDFTLQGDLLKDVKKLGAKQGASLFVTLLSGFGMLLSRLSGQQDLVIGIPAAGQSVGGHDTLVGHCVNMLPIRGNYESALELKALLDATRRSILDAYEHQEYTFGSLLKKLPIARDPSRLPLVSVIFNLDRGLTPEALKFEGLHVDLRANPRHFENFDLFVNAVDLRDKVIFECQYNTDLFDADTITRWFASLETLLQHMVANPTSSLGNLEALTQDDLGLLNSWNDTRAERTAVQCVHHLIESQVDRSPDAIAVQFDGQTISYAEFDRQANQLARRLRELGVQRDALVGICLERSIEMLVAMFAVHKAGGAYVPLDPGYPRDRLSYMVEDSAMQVLVTDTNLRTDLALPIERIVCIDAEVNAMAAMPGERLANDEKSASLDSLAYVIYTSGSTGKPKGVLIEHRSVVNLLGSLHVTPGLTQNDQVLAITTLSFDIAVSELILPLTVGARIVLVSRDVASDGARLLQTMESTGITFIDATPATYRLLIAAGWQGTADLRIVCTGEAMPRDLAVELVPRAKEVWNGYGPTETTVWSTFYKVTAPVGRILIGRPVDNTQIHILDNCGHIVPVGVTGELFIGGRGLARGYLNRPDLTAERFVPDTISSIANARMYKTGDLGRYLKDGNIECLGRNDNQVKLRGFRIELGEIENALATHSNIDSAAVIVREDRPGDRRLCAYFVARGKAVESELRSHLKETLPDYMIPQHFTALDRMPLTPSGKIDRKSLPVPSSEGRSSEDFVEPATASEKLVAELWKQALVVSRVSATDDFFALGGHSLLASQILARLRVEHGIVIPFRKMFEAPTIATFAKLVDASAISDTPAVTQSIPRLATQDQASLSLSQERIWSLNEMDPNVWRSHLLPAAWRLQGPLNVKCLESAMHALTARHDLLRARFQLVEGKPVQLVASSLESQLDQRDLTNLPEDQREAELDKIVEADVETPFDLGKAPLLRSILIKLSDTEHVLYSSRHNIIWDGWSFDLYLRDLSAAYSALLADKTPNLPALPISYADFTAWHKQWLTGPEHTKQVNYWKKQLAGEFPPLAMPTDRSPSAARTHEGANAWIQLSLADAEKLTEIGHEQGATLYTVLLSAFAALLHRYTGQPRFLIGTPVRARTRPETEDVIGPFVNTLALKFEIDPDQSFLDLVAQARDTSLDAFTYQESPLEALGANAPSVRVNFSLQDARTRPKEFGNLAISQQHVMHRSAVNDLTMWSMHSNKHLLVVVNYSTELFNASTIEQMLDAYRAVIADVLRNPKAAVGQLNLISPEAKRLTEQIGRGRAAHPGSLSLGQILVAYSKTHESKVAIKQGERSVTFGEVCFSLDAAMRALTNCGVTAASRVVVLGSPSIESLVVLLAALELGAHGVPLAASMPANILKSATASGDATFIVAEPDAYELHKEWLGSIGSGRVLSIEALHLGPGSSKELMPVSSQARNSAAIEILRMSERGNVDFVASGLDEVAQVLATLNTELEMSAADSLLSLDSYGTIAWFLEAAFALAKGVELMLPPIGRAEARALDVEWVQSISPSIVAGPAQLLHSLCLDSEWNAHCSLLISVGLPIQGLALQDLLNRATVVYNVFSFVEGGVWNCGGPQARATDRYRLGRVLGAGKIEVRDDQHRLCPIGVPGEVHVTRRDGSVLATGERARMVAEGELEYWGTAPNLAWLRGYRIGLPAIEQALLQHSAIREAAVRMLDRGPNDPALVAYVVPNVNTAYTETSLRQHLRLALPDAFVPNEFVEVAALPRGVDGTIALDQLASPFAQYERIYLPPRTEAQRLLAEMWQSALKVDRVSLDDNFFSIGGHSLLCFQVIDDVQRRTGIRLSPRNMLLDTLEQVAVGLEQPKGPTSPQEPTQTDKTLGGKLFGKLKKIVGN